MTPQDLMMTTLYKILVGESLTKEDMVRYTQFLQMPITIGTASEKEMQQIAGNILQVLQQRWSGANAQQ